MLRWSRLFGQVGGEVKIFAVYAATLVISGSGHASMRCFADPAIGLRGGLADEAKVPSLRVIIGDPPGKARTQFRAGFEGVEIKQISNISMTSHAQCSEMINSELIALSSVWASGVIMPRFMGAGFDYRKFAHFSARFAISLTEVPTNDIYH